MNLGLIILSIIAIVFGVLWASYKLKDAKKGDLIDIGFGTYVKYSAFEARVTIGLLLCFLVLLAGLLT